MAKTSVTEPIDTYPYVKISMPVDDPDFKPTDKQQRALVRLIDELPANARRWMNYMDTDDDNPDGITRAQLAKQHYGNRDKLLPYDGKLLNRLVAMNLIIQRRRSLRHGGEYYYTIPQVVQHALWEQQDEALRREIEPLKIIVPTLEQETADIARYGEFLDEWDYADRTIFRQNGEWHTRRRKTPAESQAEAEAARREQERQAEVERQTKAEAERQRAAAIEARRQEDERRKHELLAEIEAVKTRKVTPQQLTDLERRFRGHDFETANYRAHWFRDFNSHSVRQKRRGLAALILGDN